MKIQTKIFLIMLLLVMVAGTAIIVVNHISSGNMTEDNIHDHLSTAAGTRASHIRTFLNSEEEAIKQLSQSIVIEQLLLIDRDDPDYSKVYDRVTRRLKNTAKIKDNAYSVFALDRNGKIFASSEEIDIGKDKSNDPYFIGGKKGVFIKDAYIPQDIKIPTITFSAPIFDEENTVFLGVVAIRVLMKEVNKIITGRTGLGETCEIYLVNKDGYMITPSRFVDDTFLKQKVDTFHSGIEPEKYLTGHEYEVVLRKSYQGEEVISVHTQIPEMNWTVVAEMSKKEAFAPVTRLTKNAMLILVLLFLIGILASISISRTITEPIVKLYQGTEEIIKGNLDHKVGTIANDEVGQLSRAFDEM
ncbi:MAG: HAMP domain-containing protein, partial [Deltaproteobacteria bacterium]|nr:HAMP domain-containing protein [Deltaproteobacteria bacterium]